MEYKELGNTGIKVSVISLGTWQFGDPTNTYKKQSEETETQILKTGFDEGINFIDTAEGYGGGESEKSIAKCLKNLNKKREDVVLASKVLPNNLKPEDMNNSLNNSLKNLETDYLDLYQIHWPNSEIPIKNTLLSLKKFFDDGKIKSIGVSNFGEKDTEDAVACGVPIVTNQLPYSLLCRSIEYNIIDVCKKNNIGILCYSPLQQGLLSGKYKTLDDMIANKGLCRSRYFDKSRSPSSRHEQSGCEKELMDALNGVSDICKKLNEPMSKVALSWALKQPGVTSLVVGASRPEHVSKNVDAVKLKLSDDTIKSLNDATETLKKAIGNNPDLWNKESRYR